MLTLIVAGKLKETVGTPAVAGPALTSVVSESLLPYWSAAVVVTNRLHAMIFALIAGKPVLALDDGGAKTADAARRYDAPSLPVDGAISTETIGRIARERVSGPSENRRGALAEAMRLSALNFTALRAALGGAKPDV